MSQIQTLERGDDWDGPGHVNYRQAGTDAAERFAKSGESAGQDLAPAITEHGHVTGGLAAQIGDVSLDVRGFGPAGLRYRTISSYMGSGAVERIIPPFNTRF